MLSEHVTDVASENQASSASRTRFEHISKVQVGSLAKAASHVFHLPLRAQQLSPERLQLKPGVLVEVLRRVASSSTVEFNSIFDQTRVLSAERQHDSAELLETQLAGIHFVEAAVEQVNVIIRKVHEAETLR